MNSSIYFIPVPNLLLILIPAAVVVGIFYRWSLGPGQLAYATFRMVLQLVLVGFALTYVFAAENPLLICVILSAMLLIAAGIALKATEEEKKSRFYWKALASLVVGCLPVLALVVAGVIRLKPWHEARYLIPLAGMIFANAMNSLSLTSERFHSELKKGASYEEARGLSFKAALLPITNMFFAVGLVSLPGMMTGQILSGIHPLIAIRYQIMVMCMLLGAAGISSAVYLRFLRPAASGASS